MDGPTKLEGQDSADSSDGLALTSRETEHFEFMWDIINLNERNLNIYYILSITLIQRLYLVMGTAGILGG